MRIRLAYLSCCLLWGSTWMAIKIGLRDLPPLLFAGTRMLLAAALLLPFALRAGLRQVRAPALRRMAGIGLLQIGVPYALLFAAQQWIASALAAVLFATFPVWLSLIARALMADQKLTARKIAAALLGVCGVLILQLPGLRSQSLPQWAPLGGALVIAAAIIVALANVLVRRELQGFAPIVSAFVQVFSGSMLLVLLSALLERGRDFAFTPPALAALVYLAVFGTAVTYLFLFWLIPRVPMSAIGAIPLLDTTVAVTLGTLVLREPAGWPLLAGGALVLTGAGLANQTPAEPAPEAA